MSQQYQLKVCMVHHPSLKITQLIEFLQNQSNDFLTQDLPQALITNEKFIAVFESHSSQIDTNEFVGIILLYSSSNLQSFQLIKNNALLGDRESLADSFLIIVEMDNSDKKSNFVGNEGEKMCQNKGIQFIKLSLFNSDELVNNINKNLYELIENYYYPNEQDEKKEYDQNEAYVLNYTQQKVVATRDDKKSIQTLLDKASRMRESRQKQMIEQQEVIDNSIENVENVLNNINHRIKKKINSQWFNQLKNNLYQPVQKDSKVFSKIKLKQIFIDENQKLNIFQSRNNSNVIESRYNSNMKYGSIRKIENPLMSIILGLTEVNYLQIQDNITQIDIYSYSSFQDIGKLGLKKLGLNQTDKNIKLITQIIQIHVQKFIKQLHNAIQNQQKQSIFYYIQELEKESLYQNEII